MKKYTLNDVHKMDTSFKQTNMLKLFFFGFVLFSLGYTMSNTLSPIYIICDLIRTIGVGSMVVSSFKLMSFRFENLYLKIIFTFYIFWLFTVVLRGFKPEYEFIKNSLFEPGGFFLYLSPLILLIQKPPKFYTYIFIVAQILGLFYLIHIALDITAILVRSDTASFGRFEVFVKILALPCGFLLMTFNYQTNRSKLISILVISVVFFLAVYRARRGLIFISGSIFIFTFLLFIYRNKRKILLIIFSIIAACFMLVFAITSLNIGDSDLLAKANERGTEDTRSSVEGFYFADMQFKDWIIGRGMSGLVAAPIGIDINSKTPGYRTGIETDYLNIILKGGIISLGLLLLIVVPAIIQGLFLSKNTLSKAAALWILLWLVSLYPSTVTIFTLHYILVWIAIGICYSKPVRNMSDQVLKEYFLTTSKKNKLL